MSKLDYKVSRITRHPIPPRELITTKSFHKIRVALKKATVYYDKLQKSTKPMVLLREGTKLSIALTLLSHKIGIFEAVLSDPKQFSEQEIRLVQEALRALAVHGADEKAQKLKVHFIPDHVPQLAES